MDMPLPEWRDVYKYFIDLGADAVIASHPHVPQGWEIYKDKPICYSLGNFCFQKKTDTPPHWNESLCCCLDVTSPHSATMMIRPVFYDKETNYISDNTHESFSKHMTQLNDLLRDDEAYMSAVNECCKKLSPHYMELFTRSGMVTNIMNIGLLKGMAEWVYGHGFFRKEHAINNIRCESHRWAILRGLELLK